jgi:hypothetical protein
MFAFVLGQEKQFASHPPMRALPTPSDRPLAQGPTYFIDADKGDDAGDGSREKPFQTIAHALKKLQPGDTLCLRGGTYYQPCEVALQGTADQPITIRGFSGELAIIDAGIPEFFENPADAWQPAENGLPDEFVSSATYRGLEKVFGNFGDSMVPLHGYKNLIDLRSDNEFWNGGGKLDTDWSIYCGPGIWYDQTSGRVHCRLAHTRMQALGPDNYRGQTDPRKLPLVVSAAPNALHIRLAQHVRIQDLVLRGARKCALNIEDSVGIQVENVVGYGSDPVVNLRGNRDVRLAHCQFRGIAAPWSFRSSHKYRGTAAYLLVARGDDATNQDIEIAHCELTDSHDGPFIGTMRGLKFHHNLVDNFNDDGVYLTAMSLGGDVHIYQNRISRCLHAFSFFGEYPVGKGVWIYRNVVDLRAPVHYFEPSGEDDERFVAREAGERYRFPSAGRLCGDHGGPTWEPIHFYHNTVISRDAAFRNYYALGWGGHMRNTQRWVMNNIFVQREGWPGAVVLKEERDGLHAHANLHFGQGERPQSDTRYTPPESDLFADPRLAGDFADWRQPADVALQGDTPAADAGSDIPKDWPDTLRDQDAGKPDLGALPRGVDASAIGPASK